VIRDVNVVFGFFPKVSVCFCVNYMDLSIVVSLLSVFTFVTILVTVLDANWVAEARLYFLCGWV
jgi:hypothetical protein